MIVTVEVILGVGDGWEVGVGDNEGRGCLGGGMGESKMDEDEKMYVKMRE